MNIPKDYLWQDYKHIGFFKYPYIHYFLTNDKIYVNEGFLNTSCSQIALNKISTIRHSQSIFQKIFGTGTISIYTIGDSQLSLKLENIEKSDDVQELIMELLER